MSAIDAIKSLPGYQDGPFATQWSQVLDPRSDFGTQIPDQRRLSDLLEKGDCKAWQPVAGKHVVAWAPSDPNALNRLLSYYLRLPPAEVPASIIFIAPLPFFPGANTTSHYLDLWRHALLGEKHALLVKNVHLITQPVEYILPGSRGPPHLHQGLACFRLDRTGPRQAPTIFRPAVPLFTARQTFAIIVDSPMDGISVFLQRMARITSWGFTVRDPVRSASSTTTQPRATMEILIPHSTTPLMLEMMVRDLKLHALRPNMYIGHKDLYTADDALILECLAPSVMERAWPLCSEAIFLTAKEVLIRTSASADTWTELLDVLCREGELNIISEIRWKASRFGGRPWATPSATTGALAASRRRQNKANSPEQLADFITDVRVNGETGLQDKEIMDTLFAHVCTAAGLTLQKHTAGSDVVLGTWKHLASYDPAATPGRARLYLQSKAEVMRVHAALHGQLLQVGADTAITVHNDLMDVAPLQGNGRAGR